MSSDAIVSADGRRARRDQNRERVVDAMLSLYREGELQPSVAAVAERSGVSHRSVFRYFEDLDELYRVAIERQYDAVSDLMRLSRIGEGPLEDRIARLVENRLTLYETVAPVARVGHMRAPTEPVLEEHICDMAARGLGQIRVHFGAELASLTPEEAAATAEAVAGVVSIEMLEFLRHVRRIERDETERILLSALGRLLPGPARASEAE